MILTRRALLNEVATLEAQHLADSATIGRLLTEVQRLTRLGTTNVNLASQLERAELELAQLRAMNELQDARLACFMAQHPDIFRDVS